MMLGLGVGWIVPEERQVLHTPPYNTLLAVGLMVMMYPPLVKVHYETLGKVFQNLKLLTFSLVQNWLVGPLVMFILAWLCLPGQPEYQMGLVMMGLARCIAMVLVWNDLAEGDADYAAGLVALNSLFQMVGYGALSWVFLTWLPPLVGLKGWAVVVQTHAIVENVLLYLGVPFLAGLVTRYVTLHLKGKQWLETVLLPRLAPVTLWALLATIVMMFSLKAHTLFALPMVVIAIALPLAIYFGVMFFMTFILSRYLGANQGKATALAFTAAGNNFELAIAIAIAVFGVGSQQAFASVIGPLIEVPVLIVLVGVVPWLTARTCFKATHARV